MSDCLILVISICSDDGTNSASGRTTLLLLCVIFRVPPGDQLTLTDDDTKDIQSFRVFFLSKLLGCHSDMLGWISMCLLCRHATTLPTFSRFLFSCLSLATNPCRCDYNPRRREVCASCCYDFRVEMMRIKSYILGLFDHHH